MVVVVVGFERMGIPRRTAHVVIWQYTEALVRSKKIGKKTYKMPL